MNLPTHCAPLDGEADVSEAPTYLVRTLEDIAQIPPDRLDDFWVDLKNALLGAHAGTSLSTAFVQGIDPDLSADYRLHELTWIDDGANNMPYLSFDGEHMASVPGFRIPAVIDGMNHAAEVLRNR